jgi:hypothetical protein
MEKFFPVLSIIQVRLREILTRYEGYMLSWDIPQLQTVGENLVELAKDIFPQLIQVEHRVLYVSLREAGLGIQDRVTMVQNGKLTDSDSEYFRSVHEALGNICGKIETGEYYNALLAVAEKRQKEVFASHR